MQPHTDTITRKHRRRNCLRHTVSRETTPPPQPRRGKPTEGGGQSLIVKIDITLLCTCVRVRESAREGRSEPGGSWRVGGPPPPQVWFTPGVRDAYAIAYGSGVGDRTRQQGPRGHDAARPQSRHRGAPNRANRPYSGRFSGLWGCGGGWSCGVLRLAAVACGALIGPSPMPRWVRSPGTPGRPPESASPSPLPVRYQSGTCARGRAGACGGGSGILGSAWPCRSRRTGEGSGCPPPCRLFVRRGGGCVMGVPSAFLAGFG